MPQQKWWERWGKDNLFKVMTVLSRYRNTVVIVLNFAIAFPEIGCPLFHYAKRQRQSYCIS